MCPQLLGAAFFANPPSSIEWLWLNVLKPMLPARAAQKTGIVAPLRQPSDLLKLERFVRRQHLPRFMGGDATDEWPSPPPMRMAGVFAGPQPPFREALDEHAAFRAARASGTKA